MFNHVPPPPPAGGARTRFPLIVSIEHDNQVVDLVGFEEPLCSMRAKIEFNTSSATLEDSTLPLQSTVLPVA